MFRFRVLPLLLILTASLVAQNAPTATVEGRVLTSAGAPLTNGTVTFSAAAATSSPAAPESAGSSGKGTSPNPAKATDTPPKAPPPAAGTYTGATASSGNQAGRYSISGIPPGVYDMSVSDDRTSQTRAGVVVVAGRQQIDFVLNESAWNKMVLALITLGIVVIFVASVFLVRWNNIARPNRELLRAEIDKTRARFAAETGLDLRKDEPHLSELLEAAESALKPEFSLGEFLFWSRGREMTAWARIYEFQRDSVKLLDAAKNSAIIAARLQAVELDLLDIDKTHAKTLAARIKDLLDKNVQDDAILRATLVESLTYLTDETGSSFAQLVGWQTKAVWLVGVGAVLIVVLAFAVGNALLFIAGGTGGYLSRMARQLKRADVPSDYGASWTTLFLSPLMGALSGWFGILLIVLMKRLNVVGPVFDVTWNAPEAPFALGLAFLLGFSERLFDGIVSSLEDKVDQDRQAATAPKQPTSAPLTAIANPAIDPKQSQPQNNTTVPAQPVNPVVTPARSGPGAAPAPADNGKPPVLAPQNGDDSPASAADSTAAGKHP